MKRKLLSLTLAAVLALSLTYIPFTRIVFSLITVTISSLLIDRIQGTPAHAAD